MKQREKSNLIRKVTVRFTPAEYKKIYTSFKSTTKRKLSEYIRSVLLLKPVTVYTRSQSFDDFVAEIIIPWFIQHSLSCKRIRCSFEA